MNLAILFTGKLRTFEKTHKLILNNFIIPNNATLFFCIDEDKTKYEILNIILDYFPKQYLGNLCIINKNNTEYDKLLKFLLDNKPALQKEIFNKIGWTQDYMYQSGSIFEYFQFMKCYDLMIQYEKKNNCKFDIIIRSRLDIIINEPINLIDFFTKEKLINIDDDIYRRCLGNQKLCNSILNKRRFKEYNLNYYETFFDDDFKFKNNLLDNINNSKYLWVFGLNQVWIGKRHVMDIMYNLIYNYGNFFGKVKETFNSETQFAEYCKFFDIKLFKYSSCATGHYISHKKANLTLIDTILNNDDYNFKEMFIWTIIRNSEYNFPFD